MTGILEQYAEKHGWSLRRANILVEGISDQLYLELASDLAQQTTGKRLVGEDLSVFPVGDGDLGGTYGIQEQYATIYNLSRYDVDENMRRRFRVVTLLDGDSAGKNAARSIVGSNRSLELWRDVFFLQRVFPDNMIYSAGVDGQIKSLNQVWKSLDTEIEDLIDFSVYDLFVAASPHHKIRPPLKVGGAYHFFLEGTAKTDFRDFVRDNADLQCLNKLVAVLRSIRHCLGLDKNGA